MTHGFILLFHIIFYISSFTQHIQINIFKTTLRFSTYFCCSKLRQAYFTGFLQTGHWNKCVSCGFRESLRQINGLLLVGLTWAERDHRKALFGWGQRSDGWAGDIKPDHAEKCLSGFSLDSNNRFSLTSVLLLFFYHIILHENNNVSTSECTRRIKNKFLNNIKQKRVVVEFNAVSFLDNFVLWLLFIC